MRIQFKNAAKEAICENEGNKNIAVAVDGTWQKRGYTSLNGVVTMTSIDTGKSYKHKNSLPVAVVEAMRPIFRDLSHPDLLKKCLHGKTQNPNECFHNVIWSRVPKATFVQIETLSLGVYDAVCSFNDGNVSKLKMLQKMGVEPGNFQ
ncbi:uncharacterized protein TNCV_104241 [Trichonephila clavipes]|nr:uncharacterized protein TNCV_104241 [Trichonephila clavipes]